eukprot:10647292-Karenia_brevis.AAC.1
MSIEKGDEWKCSRTKTDVQKRTVTFQTELHNKYDGLSTDDEQDDGKGCDEENTCEMLANDVPPPPSGYGPRVKKGSMKIGK